MEDNELLEKWSQVLWLWRKRHHRKYAPFGVLSDTTRGQGRILALLKIRDGISIKEIAYLLGVNYSTLGELLDKLETAGYVTRETSPDDKRMFIIRLTDKGRSAQQAAPPADTSNPFACLTADEQTVFVSYLNKIIAVLQDELGIDSAETKRLMDEWRSHGCRHGQAGHRVTNDE